MSRERPKGACPYCECNMYSVTNTRKKIIKWRGKEIERVKRYRTCRNCGLSYTTIEMTEEEVTKLFQDSNDLGNILEMETPDPLLPE